MRFPAFAFGRVLVAAAALLAWGPDAARAGADTGLTETQSPVTPQDPAPAAPSSTPAPSTQPPPPAGTDATTASQPAVCTRAEFETVVDQAAAVLRDLTLRNKPTFQEKLRQLKAKRGWSQDEFLALAQPFVKDREIEVFDRSSNDLLSRISSMGEEGAGAQVPDCQMLAQLNGLMDQLVKAQNAKWTYMFTKIDAELAK